MRNSYLNLYILTVIMCYFIIFMWFYNPITIIYYLSIGHNLIFD